MKLVADESVDFPIIDALRSSGHDVVSIAEEARGADDDVVLERAVAEGAPLLTADKDFGDLVFRQGRASHGVVLLRLSGISQGLKVALVLQAFRSSAEAFRGGFSVVEPGGLRIRQGWAAGRQAPERS